MSQFDNVTIIKKANVYFDGKVTSHIVQFSNGTKKTLGIMLPGEYKFNTDAREIMEVLGGQMTVLLPGLEEWKTFSENKSFKMPANSAFKLKITTVADYCRSYIK